MEFPEFIAEDSYIDINGGEGRVFKAHCRISGEVYSITQVIAPYEWGFLGHDPGFRKAMLKNIAHGLIDHLIEDELV